MTHVSSEKYARWLQVAGLQHFNDMQQRIPRKTVELMHGIVYQAVHELLKLDGQADADRLHCRVTGSYIRGKPLTGALMPKL